MERKEPDHLKHHIERIELLAEVRAFAGWEGFPPEGVALYHFKAVTPGMIRKDPTFTWGDCDGS